MNNYSIKKNKAGFGLIEILLVVGVGMGTFLGIEQYLNLSLRAAIQDAHQTEALYWVKSSLEQARAVRDEAISVNNWALLYNLSVDPVQYKFIVTTPATVPDSWEVVSGARIEGRYTVWFTVSKVQRDAISANIIASGGPEPDDPNILKINSNVSWLENGATKQVTVSEYLANFK